MSSSCYCLPISACRPRLVLIWLVSPGNGGEEGRVEMNFYRLGNGTHLISPRFTQVASQSPNCVESEQSHSNHHDISREQQMIHIWNRSILNFNWIFGPAVRTATTALLHYHRARRRRCAVLNNNNLLWLPLSWFGGNDNPRQPTLHNRTIVCGAGRRLSPPRFPLHDEDIIIMACAASAVPLKHPVHGPIEFFPRNCECWKLRIANTQAHDSFTHPPHIWWLAQDTRSNTSFALAIIILCSSSPPTPPISSNDRFPVIRGSCYCSVMRWWAAAAAAADGRPRD